MRMPWLPASTSARQAASGTACGAARASRSIGHSGSHTETMRLMRPFQQKRQSLERARALAAALQRDRIAGGARGMRIERVGCATLCADTPACRRRCGGGGARIGDEKAGRPLRGSKAQAARRRQLNFAQSPDDESQARRLQALLHGPQRLRGARRLDKKARRALDAERRKAQAVGQPDLARERRGPAPENRSACLRAWTWPE